MSLDAEIIRREEALRRLRPSYMEACRSASDFDYKPVMDALFHYKAGEPTEKAIFVLAQCQTLLFDHFKTLQTIRYYEQQEAQLDKLKSKAPIEKQV